MKHAFIFPGQGSQAVGMLANLGADFPLVKHTFEQASDILKYDLWQLCQQGHEETLNQTEKTQPALLTASVAIWRLWLDQGGSPPSMLAGHSLGEYSALVCAQSLEFTDAVALTEIRGQLMQTAVPPGIGAMAAVLGLDDSQVIDICAQAAHNEIVTAVNFNAPGQVVIAGHQAAVNRASEQAKSSGAKKVMPLPVSVPSHCALMQPVAEKMAEQLAAVSFYPPQIPVLHNVDVQPRQQPDAIRQALVEQLYHPVPWVATIKALCQQNIQHFFECGPGKVLTALNKRIDRQLTTLPIYDTQTLEQSLQSLENAA